MYKGCYWIIPLVLLPAFSAFGVNFSAPKRFQAAPGARAIAVGDFDGDGSQDLAVTASSSVSTPGTLSILLGRGDGTFRQGATYTMGVEPFAISAGDFRGNGKLDLAVANYMSSTISILLGNGDGTFQPAVNYSLNGALPNWIAVADLDRNGTLDLVVAEYYGAAGPGSLDVLIGNGDGTFRPPVTYSTGTNGNAYAVTVADFNGDGVPDLAATDNNFVAGQIWILMGKGDGTFQPPQAFGVPIGPTAIVTGDFNHDGKADLAVGELNGFVVLMGKGDGSFDPPVSYGSGVVSSIALGDFNDDSRVDLAISYSRTNGFISVFPGSGNGTFRAGANFQSGSRRQNSLATGAFRRNGKTDIAVANTNGKSVSILMNRTPE